MSHRRTVFDCDSLEATQRLAEKLSRSLEVPITIRIDGTLGAGKTQFTKYLAVAFGAVPEDVTSPTFVLVHRYDTQPPMIHLDAYRVNDDDEFLELGIEEFFEEAACTVIEWGEKFVELLPVDHLAITIDVLSPSRRSFVVEACGERSNRIIERLEAFKN